jgi:hypothetical protein
MSTYYGNLHKKTPLLKYRNVIKKREQPFGLGEKK